MSLNINKKEEEMDEKLTPAKKKSGFSVTGIPKVINIHIGFDKMPQGLWAVLIGAASLFCMNAKVDDAGWGLFLALLMLDKREGLITFLLACLGLAGMYQHIDGAGWLLFFAFLI